MRIFLTFVLFFAILRPEPVDAQANQCRGSVVRNVIGGVLGGLLGRNSGRGSRSLENVAGAALGSVIACALSESERRKAVDSNDRALNSGQVGDESESTWVSDDNPSVTGRTRVVSRSQSNGQQCAQTTTFVVDANGEEHSETRSLCQRPDGSWA